MKLKANYLGYLSMTLVASMMILLWWTLVVVHPIDFWGIALDSPVMSLSHAINIDYWLIGGEERSIGTSQFYHPGVIYQLVSWCVYRLTAFSISASPDDLFRSVLLDPGKYWQAIQYVPLSFSLICVVLIWKFASGREKIYFPIILLSYYIVTTSTRFGMYDLFNESMVLFMAVIFFMYALNNFISKNEESDSFNQKQIIILGLVGGMLYLLKMNYVVWAISFIPALVSQGIIGSKSWKLVLRQSLIYLATVLATVVSISITLFGVSGFKRMLDAHYSLIVASGHYGSGERTIISKSEFISSFHSLYNGEPIFMWLLFALCLSVGLAVLIKRKNKTWLKQFLPSAILLVCCALIALLALLKHYVPYYVVSVVAVIPFLIVWLCRAISPWTLLLFAPLIILGVSHAANDQIDARQGEEIYAKDVLDDAKAIERDFKIKPGEVRLWMYRITAPQYQRNFIVEFTSMAKLQKYIPEVQGDEYQFSPWNDNVELNGSWKKFNQIPWQYLVVDRDGLKYVDKSIHKWYGDSRYKSVDYKRLSIIINKDG